ncbi:cytochrome ubiquinol oxidase subunit I [Anaeroselena agilis]|uniref:Cytochrome ubiquinol oxidase subunit I n=1 Tax=Anaeroselena agilis TaxID=3063788 RepID=A0ABU3P4E3_9FIRM|nr:cytochrome ubiquinol oxidase subunit I [Selenomonadales bacterium 4137-cl]
MDNTALLLARIQFGVTLTYHFLFVALTLGLSVMIAMMETVYVRTGERLYKAMARFWGKLFLINYAVAIVTGLVNEFQFGMNWAEYSRFVGSVFGPPLAFEALTAFFVESVAIGIWVYGWDRVSRRAHLAAIWLVALAANYSAFWILAANSFMQHPTGFAFRNGRLELADLGALINNPYLAYQYSHTVLSGLATAGFFIMAVSAYYLLRREYPDIFRRSFDVGLRWALVATVLVVGTGHFYNQYIARVQPMKMAASEALWETAAPAPFVVFALIDEDTRKNSYQLALPAGLSMLAFNAVNTQVRGMNDLEREFAVRFGPGDYVPPVTLLFWSFRGMVAIGLWLFVLAALCAWYWHKNELEAHPPLLKAILWSLPLPYAAVTAGWMMTEAGRQPWLVYGLLLTERGVSKVVPAASVWTSLLIYTGIYAGVALAALYIARRIIRAGPGGEL